MPINVNNDTYKLSPYGYNKIDYYDDLYLNAAKKKSTTNVEHKKKFT